MIVWWVAYGPANRRQGGVDIGCIRLLADLTWVC